jgi:hypothetical protein
MVICRKDMELSSRDSGKLSVSGFLFLAILFVWSINAAAAQPLPTTEREKIVSLIDAASTLEGAVFIRNGKSYRADSAVKFLRGKWKSRDREVSSAVDFIEKVATCSSQTGKPYLIRVAGGKETTSSEFFRSLLAGLEKEQPSPATPDSAPR